MLITHCLQQQTRVSFGVSTLFFPSEEYLMSLSAATQPAAPNVRKPKRIKKLLWRRWLVILGFVGLLVWLGIRYQRFQLLFTFSRHEAEARGIITENTFVYDYYLLFGHGQSSIDARRFALIRIAVGRMKLFQWEEAGEYITKAREINGGKLSPFDYAECARTAAGCLQYGLANGFYERCAGCSKPFFRILAMGDLLARPHA